MATTESLSNAAEQALLDLTYLNDAWADVGDASGLQPSATAGSLFIALHDVDPGEAGTQATDEVTTGEYENYARIAVARGAGGWTRASSTISNTAAISFAAAGASSSGVTATWATIGLELTGATVVVNRVELDTPIVIASGVTPQIAIGQLAVTAK